MFSSPAQAPTSYNLDAAPNHADSGADATAHNGHQHRAAARSNSSALSTGQLQPFTGGQSQAPQNAVAATAFFQQSSASATGAPIMTIQPHQTHQSVAYLNRPVHLISGQCRPAQQQQPTQIVNYAHQSQLGPQQQLACVDVLDSNNLTSQIASVGHVIFDQTSGLLRVDSHAGFYETAAGQAAVVVNPFAKHDQRQTAVQAYAICDNGSEIGGRANSRHANNQAGSISGAFDGAVASMVEFVTVDANNNDEACAKAGLAGEYATRSSDRDQSRKRRPGAKRGGPPPHPDTEAEASRRTFACPTCCKGFTEKFNMKRHMQVHSQSRPKYSCNECSKSFAWKDNFIRHKKATHNPHSTLSI